MDQPINALFFKDFKNSYIADILEEIYIKKVYESFLVGKKDLIIADVGANIGLTAYYFKDYAKQIYAVEPAKETLELLTKMVAFNKIKNITICPYAISNKNGTQKLYLNTNSTANNLVMHEDADKFEEVELLDFHEFMKRNKLDHIDFLKLDPEGEEAKIINSESFKQYAPKIKVVCGEWHEWSGVSQINFQQAFEQLGYTFTWNRNTKAATYSAVRL